MFYWLSRTLKMLCSSCPITAALVVGTIGYFVYKKLFKLHGIRPKPAAYKKDFKADTVYLYQFKRVKKAPNLSPFCIKIEVLCRAFDIPYEVCDEKRRWGRTGTLPFIELNGEHIADSDLIEQRLRKHFNIPCLPDVQESHSIALTRLADNHLFNILIRYKTAVNEFYHTLLDVVGVPAVLKSLLVTPFKAIFQKRVYQKSKMAIGDFEEQDLDDLLHRDLKAIQDHLQDQKFLFGDKLTPVDATVFGHLASVYYPLNTHVNEVLDKDFPKIVEYLERIREEIYPNDFTLTSVLVLGAIGFFVYKKFLSAPTIRPKPAIRKTDYKKDTVYLYQFKRLQNCPNLSPFCLKLEVLCRVYGIAYEVVETATARSRNGTLPFIELNGEHIADSDLIEIRLRQHFKIPSLAADQEAQAVALSRFADNHLFYILLRYKSAVDAFYQTLVGMLPLPGALAALLVPLVRAVFGRALYARAVSAIGDFEPQELDELLHRDLKVIEDSIKGKYLFGDKITPVDATVFGQLAAVYYPFRSHITDVLEKDFPKVLEYCERIRKEVYPNDFTI
ncbi:unnamed protein product [Caenorhabditis sp. 36 PRJEB53466]|nr:unnamed protein product [Caenorhabditis sp. 36 PRJEB53466]